MSEPDAAPAHRPGARPDLPEGTPEASLPPLRSVHTTSLPPLLDQLGVSLLVSTYQAHRLIVVRTDDGVINTHFRIFNKPMGLAVDPSRLAIGTAREVRYYSNMPEVGRKLEPADRHDACFLPRSVHVTGDIDIHEMGWGGDGALWLVNTRFSCLCTLDQAHSFVPRWRPAFVTALAPEDRCHLNGLGLVEGRPRYVTALGESDAARGWRPDKAHGGLVMDLSREAVIGRGLSMPHSPRWYGGRLWVLESGRGSLATLDPDSGRLETVARLPGFTRGLDFCGPYAFVGLSQVRETAVFSGIPLTEGLTERTCGVWVIHLETGETVAFLKFEDAVQEIFAVQALPGIRFPEILEPQDRLIGQSYALPPAAG